MSDSNNDKQGSRPEVLVISADGPALAPLLERLSSEHVRPTCVAGTAQGDHHLRSGRFPIAIIDIDGLDVLADSFFGELRKSHPTLSILVTGTAAPTSLLVQLIHIGVHDFLPKPYDVEQLVTVVKLLSDPDSEKNGPGRPAAHLPRHILDGVELTPDILRAQDDLEKMNQSLKEHVSQATILFQMARDLSENENWTDALDRFLMALVNFIDADGAALLLFSEEHQRLAARATFQIGEEALTPTCNLVLDSWEDHPRAKEIHAVESYGRRSFTTCLEQTVGWRLTLVPLYHRRRALGFLLVEKAYPSALSFRVDYQLLNTIQTILGEEVANASYISELRQLGRFNTKVLDNIHSGVVTTDLDGHIRFSNQEADAMCPGLKSASAKNVHFNDLFRSESLGEDIYGRVRLSSKDNHVLEVKCLGRPDSEFPTRLSMSKMHDDNLNGTVIVAIFEDLTEQKNLEDEIRRHDRLRVLGQLSAGVAHEIRNPLTGIATSAEVLGGKIRGDEDKTQYVRAILDEIHRLDEIIRNLLNYARPPRPQIGTCLLADLSDRVIQLLSDEASKKGIQIEVQDNLLHRSCRADGNQLTQVLLNIVLNGIQACKKNDQIEIILSNEEADRRGYARIDVIDSGPGINPEIRNRLFEPFVTTKTTGTGLGLAISQQIIEEHQGKISCRSLDKGTQFSIRLPVNMQEPSVTVD